MVSRSAVKESSSTCSCWGMVKLPPYGFVLGMNSLQLEPEGIMEEPSPSPKDRKSQPTWRLNLVAERNGFLPFARYASIRTFGELTLFGSPVHYEIRLFG